MPIDRFSHDEAYIKTMQNFDYHETITLLGTITR